MEKNSELFQQEAYVGVNFHEQLFLYWLMDPFIGDVYDAWGSSSPLNFNAWN